MAKVAFSKLNLKLPSSKTIEWEGQNIEVIQYLPVEEKTQFFERVLNNSVDDNGYYNITKIDFNLDLEIIFTYTNISFTEKQKEDLMKLYDKIKGGGLLTRVKEAMPPEELNELVETVWGMVKNIYEYNRSALGIMKTITTDYSNLNLDTTEIQKALQDPDNVGFVKEVMDKMG